MMPSLPSRLRALVTLCGALVIGASACGERVDVTGTAGAPRTGISHGGGSGGGIVDRLVGHWSRTVLLQDHVGAVHASRTSWRFGADASATRTVVSSNLTFGFVDSVVTRAHWRIQGSQLVISYQPAGSGDVRFDFLLQGSTLILDGLPFERR